MAKTKPGKTNLMDIAQATSEYETWLGKHIAIDKVGLQKKHNDMAQDSLLFLRATYYRWAQIWPKVCKELAGAPVVLAVGDLHIENFGTWRDCDGRLIWGINDFDETYNLPYTNDLVRLATSAHLAIIKKNLELSVPMACKAILKGYKRSLEAGGDPFVLAEKNRELRAMARGELRDPVLYWQKMDSNKPAHDYSAAVKALEGLMPEKGIDYRVVSRLAGEGSLGRQRFVALAEWRGGRIAREAKALVPSACVWAEGDRKGRTKGTFYEKIITRAIRCTDPFVHVKGRWIVRRLAPDCSRIGLSSLALMDDQLILLESMGWETANIHMATSGMAATIMRDMKKRSPRWLEGAVKQMTEALHADWKDWKSTMKKA